LRQSWRTLPSSISSVGRRSSASARSLSHQSSRISRNTIPNATEILTKRTRSTAAAVSIQETSTIEVPHNVGDVVHGFTVQKIVPIDEFQLTAVTLEHKNTGAKYLHLARNDSNNVFSVGFRTTPTDDTGVAHILEHTVLCGSQLYPCRDPFFKMLNRSLATFMNAMTASDWTMYPFATTNQQDFYNLLGVYLDATFFPNLEELDFLQEGWRLEYEDPNSQQSEIAFKGVVYNEMKGALSSPDALFCIGAQQHLHSGTTYENVSGGDPTAITDLTWNQLKQFHSQNYHPSNSNFYSYGDFPLAEHLKVVDDHVLSKFELEESYPLSTAVHDVPRWTSPREVSSTCPEDAVSPDPTRQGRISVSYLLPPVSESYEQFTLRILSMLLVDGPSSPFFQSLVESGLGADFSANSGFDSNTREASFAVGVQGAHPDDFDKIKQVIEETFKTAEEEGFDQKQVDAILHQVELSQKQQNSNFGLNVGIGLMGIINHDADPIDALYVNAMVEKFKVDLSSDPKFLTKKVREHFLNNSHKLTFAMTPHADYNKGLDENETMRLEKKVAALTEDEKAHIFATGQALLKAQDEHDDGDCLPTLHVSDIQRVKSYDEVSHSSIERSGSQVPLQICEQPTNGIVHFRAVIDTAHLPDHLIDYFPLFASVLCSLGTEQLSYQDLAHNIKSTTGGLGCKTHLVRDPTNAEEFEQGIMISSQCLSRNIDHMFELWSDIFSSPNFNERGYLQTLVAMDASDLTSSIAQSGHTFAQLIAASAVSDVSKRSNRLSGLDQVALMQVLAASEDVEKIIAKLEEIAKIVLKPQNIRCSLVADASSLALAVPSLTSFLQQLPIGDETPEHSASPNDSSHDSANVFVKTPFTVNYAGQSIPTVSYTHEDSAALSVLAKGMSAKFLHREIREKGGAYGGGASAQNGLFHYYSYRDPNTTATLEAFNNAAHWAAEGNLTDQDIEEAKLSIFQSIDAPSSPGNRGNGLFVSNLTNEQRQVRREQLLDVTKSDCQAAAETYLVSKTVSGTAIVGTVADAETFETQDGWKVRTVELD